MSDYQAEQLTGLKTVINHLAALSEAERQGLRAGLSDYLDFRQRTERFLAEHFGRICSRKCYESRLSACCSKDGIITFFADVVINALLSKDPEIAALIRVLEAPHGGFKCVYLGERGCLWRVNRSYAKCFSAIMPKSRFFPAPPHAKSDGAG